MGLKQRKNSASPSKGGLASAKNGTNAIKEKLLSQTDSVAQSLQLNNIDGNSHCRQQQHDAAAKNNDGIGSVSHETRTMKDVLGFDWHSCSSYGRFVKLCHAPTDPSNLSIFRIAFGKKNFAFHYYYHHYDFSADRQVPHLLYRYTL